MEGRAWQNESPRKNTARRGRNPRSADSLVRVFLVCFSGLADKAVRAPGKSSQAATILEYSTVVNAGAREENFLCAQAIGFCASQFRFARADFALRRQNSLGTGHFTVCAGQLPFCASNFRFARAFFSPCADEICFARAISQPRRGISTSARAKTGLRGHFSVCASVAAGTRRQTEAF